MTRPYACLTALPLAFVLLLAPPSQAATNLNTHSTLDDAGYDMPPAPTTILGGIPVMEGLHPLRDKNLLRILPTATDRPIEMVGILDVDDIYNYYKRTLPPLGWQLSGGRDYTKGQAHLHIDVRADGKASLVTFTQNSLAQ